MSAQLQLSTLPHDTQVFLARIGRRFGARQVAAQGQQTLAALARFGAELRLHGFSEADREWLGVALAAAAVLPTRDKSTDRAYVHALGQAKDARARARSVLLSAYRRLRAGGRTDMAAAMQRMAVIISATAEPGGDDRVYAEHLAGLREILSIPEVAREVAASGGPEADAMLAEALATLRRLDAADLGKPITEADVLDGLIVELCRTAQFAAQSLAKETGNNNFAGPFRLGKLMKEG